ncbi:hypothetical protein [Bradyrhizobium japonicum]|uniref:hypothetical protein n=1 Tax=Bradyrhizobium japonicum TaxID=375 RepID=UPI00209E9827|nr:hypothetical protein [Bradyrhizobium japonicum]MCP1761911.1 prolyl-tRNA synthetase [Bradyrhizobium japonicum]MCP1793491.1 prolyl-tRNA synthetase [Bradyrhizobium japonicum]MCP1805924.1 prolyl-tRNA synthetase [Bradyrhizobium japonicum]MCP1812327.1 prolyl-tRNA synthetase [Bradyrhizobium japonicum]MCP1873630.1 prolyl-tRNA synthetase [Bradyrhizobium japonicum]
MAKQEPLPDRFRITCETSESEMGVLIAQLTRMGFTNISFELITDVPAFRRNAARDGQQSASEFALAWISENLTFNARDLVKHFKADGRNSSACYYAVKKLVEVGTIIDLGNRNYQRADVKAIEAPDAAPKKFATRGEDEILKFARQHGGKFNTAQIVKLFEEHGRARNSVYASTNALLNEKMIKRVGESGSGDYRLLAKGKAHKPRKARQAALPKSTPAPALAPHLNGGSHHPEINGEAVING